MRSMSFVLLVLKVLLVIVSAGCGNDPGSGVSLPDQMGSGDLALPPAPADLASPPDGPRLPEGVACALNGPWPVDPCTPKSGCRVCMARFGAPAVGVCVEPCSTALQDCSNGRTCRVRAAPPYAYFIAGLDCADGYCD